MSDNRMDILISEPDNLIKEQLSKNQILEPKEINKFKSEKGVVYIYALHDPTQENIIRYIGAARVITRRYKKHFQPLELTKGTNKSKWLKSLYDQEVKPGLSIIEETTEEEWEKRETFWIKWFRDAGYPLTNMADGGKRGIGPSPETIEKLRELNLGKKATEETRKKLSESHMGHHPSEETRKKMSESHKNLPPRSEETRRKSAERAKGQTWSRGKKMTGKSKYVGVGKIKKNGKFRAYITVNDKFVHLGTFVTEEDAARAYNAAALLHFGEGAVLNIIEP